MQKLLPIVDRVEINEYRSQIYGVIKLTQNKTLYFSIHKKLTEDIGNVKTNIMEKPYDTYCELRMQGIVPRFKSSTYIEYRLSFNDIINEVSLYVLSSAGRSLFT